MSRWLPWLLAAAVLASALALASHLAGRIDDHPDATFVRPVLTAESTTTTDAPPEPAQVQPRVQTHRKSSLPVLNATGAVNGYPCGGVLPPCRVLACESGGNPTARNPSSSASGLWQILDGTWFSLETTRRTYSKDLRRYLSWLAENFPDVAPIGGVKRGHIDLLMRAHEEKGMANTSLARMLSVVSSFVLAARDFARHVDVSTTVLYDRRRRKLDAAGSYAVSNFIAEAEA